MRAETASGRPALPDRADAPPPLQRWVRAVRWYVRSMMGDDAYERYRTHYLRAHPDGGAAGTGAMMTEREFWRDRTDRQDAQPQGRCC